MTPMDSLLYLAGVSADYLDYHGLPRDVPRPDRLAILAAMGLPGDDADTDAVVQALHALDARPWQRWLRSFTVLDTEQPLAAMFHPDELDQTFSWRIDLEEGGSRAGEVVPCQCQESGNYVIDGVRYSARDVPLPPLPPGYHQVTLGHGGRSLSAQLAVCPATCFQRSLPGERLWGVTCQLYSLRSDGNWGMGDFGDLVELIDGLAARGADMVFLNPLHAPGAGEEGAVSPYSPSDRRFLNPLYIAPALAAGNLWGLREDWPGLASEAAALRRLPFVDYQGVATLKYRAFRLMYRRFRQGAPGMGDAAAFDDFVRAGGDSLADFCRYECAHNPHGAEYGGDPGFFAYLQWLASSQLAHCQRHALERGMSVGLVGDLAVGAIRAGSEVATDGGLYAQGVSIGAPPDPFAATGQDWGLPPMAPVALRQSGFARYIALLRANMAPYGALRFDHVMSIMRLWWCLPVQAGQPGRGAYVYYPFREMLALLKLESHRQRCQVVGEDLGVVPPDFRHQMHASGVLGNDVFYFQQYHDGRFLEPCHYREQGVLMVTNHDLPTLAEWWCGGDIHRRWALGVMAEDSRDAMLAERNRHKHCLLELLVAQGLVPEELSELAVTAPLDDRLNTAIHRLCGRSASRWVLVQLEDLQRMAEPINIPGTHRQYPNWRRKQGRNTSDLFADPDIGRLLAAFVEERVRHGH